MRPRHKYFKQEMIFIHNNNQNCLGLSSCVKTNDRNGLIEFWGDSSCSRFPAQTGPATESKPPVSFQSAQLERPRKAPVSRIAPREAARAPCGTERPDRPRRPLRRHVRKCSKRTETARGHAPPGGVEIGRRRVGKECLRLCRSRWSPYH